jgi:uncharacterized protein YndB with AHSA1/START domain
LSKTRRFATLTSNHGPILIADITGYSRFLNESELVHAGQTLSALLEVMVEQTRPPLVVSKLEGDAVFSYGIDGNVLAGQAFVESIEASYVEFRRALELMVLNTSCTCNACANISGLDLKFFVHHGEFVLGETAGRTELHGSDVNLLHRLLKNTVTAETGITAYVMYTRQAVEALGLGELTESMALHSDTYDDVGVVDVRVEDLGPVWEAAQAATTFEFEEVGIDISTTIDLPPEAVWGYLVDPEYRKTISGSDRQEIQDTRQGRVGEGSVYQCYHGDQQITQLILEWKPLERVVFRFTEKIPGGTLDVIFAYVLEREGERTRLMEKWPKPGGSGLAYRIIASSLGERVLIPWQARKSQRGLDAFRDRIESAYVEQSQTVAPAP